MAEFIVHRDIWGRLFSFVVGGLSPGLRYVSVFQPLCFDKRAVGTEDRGWGTVIGVQVGGF